MIPGFFCYDFPTVFAYFFRVFSSVSFLSFCLLFVVPLMLAASENENQTINNMDCRSLVEDLGQFGGGYICRGWHV